MSRNKPSHEALESKADAILRRDDDVMVNELKQHAQRMEDLYREALLPRNDPEYLAKLEKRSEQVDAVGNKVDVVHVIKERGKTRIEVGMANERDHAGTLQAGRDMAEMFEARLMRHDDPHEVRTSGDYTAVRQPRKEFGREKRSLPR